MAGKSHPFCDNQHGKQIHLYRTLYPGLLHPKFLSLTPYENLQFTHRAGYANRPPHYGNLVYCTEGEISYRWSMKKDSWHVAYQNSIKILPDRDKE